jgi:hypothetical protein
MGPVEDVTFEEFLLLVGKLNYAWTNTESLLIHLIAGLSRVDKETAVIIFLTLNTARARLDLVERLAKMPRVDPGERDAILGATRKMSDLSRLRNRYNHCIYAFDPDGGAPRSILMRIADRKAAIKIGEVTDIDQAALQGISDSINALGQLNLEFWNIVQTRGYPV